MEAFCVLLKRRPPRKRLAVSKAPNKTTDYNFKMKLRITLALSLLILITADHFGQSSKPGPGRKYTSVERMNIARLRSVHESTLRYQSSRRPVKLKTGYEDFRAILHAHAEDSPHTAGTRTEMLEAAKRAGVRIIMLTDHIQPDRDFITDSWRGIHDGVLFIPGAEAEGFLAYPTTSIRGSKTKPREEFIRIIKQSGGNAFLSHVEERLDWETSSLDGLEIYNHHTDVKDEEEFNTWLRGALSDAARLKLIEQGLALYPQEVFAAQQDYLSSIIEKWDRDARSHRLTGVAANDCHHNQVFTITVVDENTVEVSLITSRPVKARVSSKQSPGVAALVSGRKPGEVIAHLDIDPYERSFRYVTTHILVNQLAEPDVREALRRGHAYVSHDWLCDPTGFAFVAESGGKARAVMGDEVMMKDRVKIKAETPAACTLKLFYNGAVVKIAEGRRLDFEANKPGIYRLEAWLEVDGEQRPWIYANPIYVR